MISIIIPYIRPKNMEKLLYLIHKNAGFDDYEIITEEDKDRIGCPKMVVKLVEKAKYDLVMFMGDDCLPRDNFLKEAVSTMTHFKDGWGVVGLNDLTGRLLLPCHWLAHKRMLVHTKGEFFHTGYKHCFCDLELRDIAVELGRYAYSLMSIVEHNHPVLNNEVTNDADYIRVYSKEYTDHDNKLYLDRKKARHKKVLGDKVRDYKPKKYELKK